MKTHFQVNDAPVCGRGARISLHPRRVDCLLCRNTVEFKAAEYDDEVARAAAFQAQVPQTFREPWYTEPTLIVCDGCGADKFRMADRTCYGHYENYVCASCGHTESRLTETGMSF